MRIPRINTQRGITLVESIATLGIMSAVAVGTVMMSSQYSEDTRTTGAAEHMKMIAEATRAYVRDNRAVIIGAATSTKPVLITAATLSGANYLPSGVSPQNAFGQNVCALVLEPSPGVLSTMIIAEGGDRLDDVHLAHFSSMMGASGGGVFSNNTTQILGGGGTWSLPLSTFNNRVNTISKRCDGTTGNVQITAGTPVYAQWMDGTDTADPGFLSRDVVPGNPSANTMDTNIDMGGNRIHSLANYTAGTSCPAGVVNGEIATGSRNEILACNGGTWERQGMAYDGGSVTDFSDLPLCSASRMGSTIRVTSTSGLYLCSGIRWNAALNASNDFVLPDHLRVGGSAVVTGNASIGGNATISGSARIVGNTRIDGQTTLYDDLNARQNINLADGKTINGAGTMQIEAQDDLYLKPWANTGQVVVGKSGGAVNLYSHGRVTANGTNAFVARSNSYGFVAQDSGGNSNASAKSKAGSMSVNDVYVRSVGRWLSQIAADGVPRGTQCGATDLSGAEYLYADCMGHNPRLSCPAGYSSGLSGSAASHWFYTCFKN